MLTENILKKKLISSDEIRRREDIFSFRKRTPYHTVEWLVLNIPVAYNFLFNHNINLTIVIKHANPVVSL